MANPEYLRNFRPDLLSGDIYQMLAENRTIDRITLVEYLKGAYDNLVTTPGPNLSFRREHAPGWIGWWLNFLEENNGEDRGQLVPFDKIKSSLVEGKTYGVLNAGSFEGTEGHRFAARWLDYHVSPILLIERDWYAESKKRGGPYLDLRARVSMWAYLRPTFMVSVLPEKPKGVDDNVYYQSIFDRTGARYCFASEADPLCEVKTGRGEYAPFLKIPARHIQSTTDDVRKLMPEDDLGRLINTTDNVTRLMPKIDEQQFLRLTWMLKEIEEERLTQI